MARCYVYPSTQFWSVAKEQARQGLSDAIDNAEERLKVTRYCSDHGIEVKTDLYAVRMTGETTFVIAVNGTPYLSCDVATDGVSTYPAVDMLGTDEQKRAETITDLRSVGFTSLMIAYGIETGTYRVKKRIPSKFGTNIALREFSSSDGYIKVIDYDHSEDGFLFKENNGQYSFLSLPTMKTCTIATPMYPLPNDGDVSMFRAQTTKDLDDGGRLAEIMDAARVTFNMGHCYSNAQKIIDLLHNAGYDKEHSVHFYCGWVVLAVTGNPIHHAWVVIDGKSVIDVAIQMGGPMAKIQEDMQKGIPFVKDRTELAKEIKAYEREQHGFAERYGYGKCHNACYVGVLSNPSEGIEAFRRLIAKYPNHPSYKNVDKRTGTNALNRAYYGLGE